MHEIMLVDDDSAILDMVELILRRDNYHIVRAQSSRRALELVERQTPDCFILDAMMPDMDGLMLCRRLRAFEHTRNIPVLFLTGNGDRYGVVDALASGADDYLKKPFQPRELTARVRALIRRASYLDRVGTVVRFLTPDHHVCINDREVTLTRVEYDLLRFLALTPHQLHTTEALLLNVWAYPDGVGDAALVRNHVRNLRRKIELDPERPLIVQSRHGRGYMMRARVEFAREASEAR